MRQSYSFAKYHPGVNPSHPGFKTRPPHDVFPEDLECVLEGEKGKGAIFIGNLEAAESLQTLKKHGIASILTACKNVHIKHPKEHVPYSLYIPGEDHQNYDLSVHFDSAINFIHHSRRETNILVHCMAGVSRSVTLVLAYLIKHMGMTYQEAYRTVQRKRTKINPNPGFIRQLQRWQQKHLHDRTRQRHSSEHCDHPKTSYEGFYKNRPLNPQPQPQPQENDGANRSPGGKYKVGDYGKFGVGGLENCQYKNYNNPEFDQSIYKSSSFSSAVKTNSPFQPVPRNPSDTRLKQVLNTMHTSSPTTTSPKLTFSTPIPRDRSIQNLSRDLDERIAKIKQKYYEATNGSFYQPARKLQASDCRRWEASHVEGRTANYGEARNSFGESRMGYEGRSYMGESLARSRASRESLRSSLYAPYNGGRALTYQYA